MFPTISTCTFCCNLWVRFYLNCQFDATLEAVKLVLKYWVARAMPAVLKFYLILRRVLSGMDAALRQKGWELGYSIGSGLNFVCKTGHHVFGRLELWLGGVWGEGDFYDHYVRVRGQLGVWKRKLYLAPSITA